MQRDRKGYGFFHGHSMDGDGGCRRARECSICAVDTVIREIDYRLSPEFPFDVAERKSEPYFLTSVIDHALAATDDFAYGVSLAMKALAPWERAKLQNLSAVPSLTMGAVLASKYGV